jgi:hypothetical protein
MTRSAAADVLRAAAERSRRSKYPGSSSGHRSLATSTSALLSFVAARADTPGCGGIKHRVGLAL